MLAKQITSRLKQQDHEDKEGRENKYGKETKEPASSSNLTVIQCDRLIRTVSCKPFHETKLYISPNYLSSHQSHPNTESATSNSNEQSQHQAHTIIDATFSTKLKRRNENANTNNTLNNNNSSTQPNMSETSEVNVKDLLDQIVENLTILNVSQWFAFNPPTTAPSSGGATKKGSFLNVAENGTNVTSNLSLNDSCSQTNETQAISMFDSIQQALNHIDFNLKRNSDFINELTKLLDTSRALKLETQLKKMSKAYEEERASHLEPPPKGPASQPGSPSMRSAGSAGHKDDEDENSKKKKSKSFKLSTLSLTSKSDAKHAHESKSSLVQPTKDISESLLNIEANFRQQMQMKSHEINNSDYIELEKEVEKISFELDSLFRLWTRICSLSIAPSSQSSDQLKNSMEFQILISNINSAVIAKNLEQSLFKMNWLITSKSGFNEPNWQSCVLSLTPSTNDSFIGVNLLKNYYKYVKYDFVSYKLFTRQLQLIQLCAIILNAIHRILLFYRETVTLSSITNNLNGPAGCVNDLMGSSLLSFNFSSDKYRPISWSANHVTLYNVQNSKTVSSNQTLVTSSDRPAKSGNVSRNSSTRRDESRGQVALNKEDHIRQIKTDVFIKELNDFLLLTTNRLNIQAHMANRTGYFYVVNQSTGLVLQAVDFTSECSLKEQIEQNQKRLQNTSIKSGQSSKINANNSTTQGTISKGPRFYLMNKMIPSSGTSNSPSATKPSIIDSTIINTDTQTDEQLWYYYLINGCVANKIIRSGYCMAASSLNTKSPVCFWPNVKTTNCSWYFNSLDQTIVSGLSDDLVLDYVVIDEPPNQRYAVVIDTKVPNKVSQKWSFEFC